MAYADRTFYSSVFHGDVLTADNAEKWLDHASDAVDQLTFGRLISAFPVVDVHAVKVKKAVCAIAEALYRIDEQRKAALVQKAEDGSYHGAIASISSGKESISYVSGNNAAASSVYAAAAADATAQTALVRDIAAIYLANVPDANGINLLYAGGCHV